MFDSILGNNPIKAYLTKALLQHRLPQTLLFSGPDGIGKSLFAKAVAAHLLGSEKSVDLHLISPEGKSGVYAIDTIREMIDKEHSAPFEAPGKVFILEEVDRMQPACANALLKTLEEPSPDTTFILLTSDAKEILPTLLSRCSTLNFQPLSEGMIAALLENKGHSPRFAKWAHGSAGRAFELAEHPEIEEQRQILFQLLSQKLSYPDLALQLEKLEKKIEEGKEEDPVRTNRRVVHLFASILMWHRDQHARQIGSKTLFFPEEPSREPVPLPEVEKAIEKALLAYQRNMKLSACFSSVLLA